MKFSCYRKVFRPKLHLSNGKIKSATSKAEHCLRQCPAFARRRAKGQHVLDWKSRSRILQRAESVLYKYLREERAWGRIAQGRLDWKGEPMSLLSPREGTFSPREESRAHPPGQKRFSSVNSIQEERAATVYSRL